MNETPTSDSAKNRSADESVDPSLSEQIQSLHQDEQGATMLEWCLLLAAIALPSYFIIRMGLEALIGHYQLIITMVGAPTP